VLLNITEARGINRYMKLNLWKPPYPILHLPPCQCDLLLEPRFYLWQHAISVREKVSSPLTTRTQVGRGTLRSSNSSAGNFVVALFVIFGYIPGTDNVADMFTKALERIKYAEYAGVLMSTLSDMRSWWKQ
jgi:hypothetical protein